MNRRKEAWPSGQSCHWNNNAETSYPSGEGLEQAMMGLLEEKR